MARQSSRRRATHKLPWQQFIILSLVRFAEPIALTSVFPYLPSMIQSFPGVTPADVGFWTGVAAAIFSLAQCSTAISWGRASDRYGRKPIILLGLFCTMCTSLLWGFSTTLPLALLARGLQGGFNGNVGILRTVVAEITPSKELQPRAFSIMPTVYSLGSIVGPVIGAFANPLDRQPGDSAQKYGSLFWKFPYLLPNLICAAVFLVGIPIGTLFLNESLESKKDKRDLGVDLGRKITGGIYFCISRIKQLISGQPLYSRLESSLDTTRRKVTTDVESVSEKPKVTEGPPSYSSVLTRQTNLYLAVYTALAMQSVGFDQMITVLMHHPRSGPLVGETQLPFKFSKGFGMDTQKIGLLFTLNGCVCAIVQLFIFPPIARKIGPLSLLRIVLHLLTIVYVALPYTTLIEDERLSTTALFCVWMLKSACSFVAFPCCTILLTNSATSVQKLATLNGVATAVSGIGRASGPSITGAAFTWGVKSGYLISPFVCLFIMAVTACIPLYFATEGAGFGGKVEEDDQDECDNDDIDNQNTLEAGGNGKFPIVDSTRSSEESSASYSSSFALLNGAEKDVQITRAQAAPDVPTLLNAEVDLVPATDQDDSRVK